MKIVPKLESPYFWVYAAPIYPLMSLVSDITTARFVAALVGLFLALGHLNLYYKIFRKSSLGFIPFSGYLVFCISVHTFLVSLIALRGIQFSENLYFIPYGITMILYALLMIALSSKAGPLYSKILTYLFVNILYINTFRSILICELDPFAPSSPLPGTALLFFGIASISYIENEMRSKDSVIIPLAAFLFVAYSGLAIAFFFFKFLFPS